MKKYALKHAYFNILHCQDKHLYLQYQNNTIEPAATDKRH